MKRENNLWYTLHVVVKGAPAKEGRRWVQNGGIRRTGSCAAGRAMDTKAWLVKLQQEDKRFSRYYDSIYILILSALKSKICKEMPVYAGFQ